MNRNGDYRKASNLGIGIAIGVGIGAALGIALENIALGVGLGIAMGIAVSLAMPSRDSGRAGTAKQDASGDDGDGGRT